MVSQTGSGRGGMVESGPSWGGGYPGGPMGGPPIMMGPPGVGVGGGLFELLRENRGGALSGGADLTMLEGLSRTFADLTKSQGEEAANKRLFEESRKLSQIARRMETCGKPWVAALNGKVDCDTCKARHQWLDAAKFWTAIGIVAVIQALTVAAAIADRR